MSSAVTPPAGTSGGQAVVVRVVAALVGVLGLLLVLTGLVLGGVGVSTGSVVTKVSCGSYFSPDESAARARDESLVERDWTDVLRGRAPEVGTRTRDECAAARERRATPVWSFVAVGTLVVVVGVGLAVFAPGRRRVP